MRRKTKAEDSIIRLRRKARAEDIDLRRIFVTEDIAVARRI